MGFTVMTSVQKQSIPAVLSGRDVLIRSQTGSGKCFVYVWFRYLFYEHTL